MAPKSVRESYAPPQRQPEWQATEVEDESEEEEQVEEREQGNGNGPAHHPTAPSDELFDISTTVDPSYIISLIRKLLPSDAQGGDPCNESSEISKTDIAEEAPVLVSDANVHTMDIGCTDFHPSPRSAGPEGDDGCFKTRHAKRPARELAWEESGCILWDLSANKFHAEFMVENLVLEVLLANLMTSDAVRIKEICLGIIGNLACHEVLMKQITSTRELKETVIDQVFSEDTLCLCETFRVLTLCLQGPECVTWAKALSSDNILSRILWVAENTLNPLLIEKSVGFLLAITENQQEVAPVLLPTIVNMGLLRILVNLLSFEIDRLTSERMPERYPALDSILRAIEALSTIGDYSLELCSNKELFQMATKLVKLPDKTEVASSCVTAAVLIANILTDAADSALELSKDLLFLQCLFDLFPFTSDDLDARNALWSIVARLLVRAQETEISRSSLAAYISVLVSKSDLIEDDLLDHQPDMSTPAHENSGPSAAEVNFRALALKRIISILKQWNELKHCTADESFLEENHPDDRDVHRLLECCLKNAC